MKQDSYPVTVALDLSEEKQNVVCSSGRLELYQLCPQISEESVPFAAAQNL
jgi:hypothetical protein